MAEEQKQSTASQIGNAAVNKGVEELGKKAALKLATRFAAGAATGGIGTAAAEIGSRAATFINKNKGKIGKLGAGLVAAPFALGAGLIAAIGTGVAALGSALIIAVIAVPLTVAFFLLIINNSAYLVPPSGVGVSGGASQSQYISITKTPDPSGPFQNEDLPLTVTYTITIGAKEQTISNVTLSYECFVSMKEGTKECPPDPIIPAAPSEIAVGTPFTFSYTMNYDPTYVDALITDTISVDASLNGVAISATGSASIIIGDPPTSCFEFDGWPENEKILQTQAIAQMTSSAPSFSARLCAGGPITLLYSTEQVSWGGWHMGNRRILIYPNGRGSLPNRYYTLTHEVGHVYGAAYRSNLLQYRDDLSVRNEAPICTYPLANHPWFEDYAEMISLYLTQGSPQSSYRNFNCLNGLNFRQRYPVHWQWARDNIILEDLGW